MATRAVSKQYANQIKLARSAFAFLEEEYGCKNVRQEMTAPYGWDLYYANKSTGVRFNFSSADGGMYITLSRLVDGQFPPYPRSIGDETEILTFDLQDLRSIQGLPQFASRSDRSFDSILSSASSSLRESGHQILQGDFSSFDVLSQLVKQRAKQLREK